MINHAVLLRRLEPKVLKVVQEHYKSYYREKVRFEHIYVPRDFVFVYRPSLTTSAPDDYSKLMLKSHGLYRLLSVALEYMKML